MTGNSIVTDNKIIKLPLITSDKGFEKIKNLDLFLYKI